MGLDAYLIQPSMSALGQKQTFKRLRLMSALPPKADIGSPLLDYLVGAC